MVEPSTDVERGSSDPARGFEELLSRCIEAQSAGDGGALEGILHEHPGDAPRLRRRLTELENLGLLDLGLRSALPPAIGGHRILRRLGSGGMGDVYLATEPESGRPVALKWARLGSGPVDGEQHVRLRARFEREARAIARLSHPGIATVHRVGEHEGRPWFSMDLVEGVTLARLLSGLRARGVPPPELRVDDVRAALADILVEEGEGQPPDVTPRARSYVEWCLRVVLDVAGALAHAHEHGIVHRDVKPSNVMIRPDGRACLFDLGLAHLEDLPTITRSGDFAGTPFYVAPEQVEGRRGEVDRRTDVWGLAVTLFELLTLRRPFEGESTPQILRRIVDLEPTPPSRHHAGLPRDLEAIVLQALEKSPQRRYAGMEELAADLERFLAFRPVAARPAGALVRLARVARRRRAMTAALALAGLVAVGLPLGLFVANRAIRVQAERAAEAALEAGAQAQARARVVEHLVDLFRSPDAVTDGMVAALDGEVERLLIASGEASLARASMLEAAGTIYRNVGLYAKALPLLDRALALRTAESGGDAVETAGLLEVLAGVHLALDDRATTRVLCRRGLEAIAALEPTPEPVSARLCITLARALDPARERTRIEQLLDRAEAGFGTLPGPASSELADVHSARAELARAEGDLQRARDELARGHSLRRTAWLPDPLRLAADLEGLIELDSALGQSERASELRARATALRAAARPLQVELLPPPILVHTPGREAYDEAFQLGITALQARRLGEAIARFGDCLELRPRRGVCAYNVACGHALAGDAEAAFAWLERAIDWGWGLSGDRIEVLRTDADLSALRSDRRFAELERELAADLARATEFVAQPARWLPAAPVRAALIVLHDSGATKLDVVTGPWREFAERHGLALIAPSAARALHGSPELGLAWFDEPATFAERPWSFEQPVVDAIEAARRDLGLAPERILLAGEGDGGCVALDLALRAPGLVRGVLAWNAPLLLEGAGQRARVAAAMGLEIRVSYAAIGPIRHSVPGTGATELVAAGRAWCASLGLVEAFRFEALDVSQGPPPSWDHALEQLLEQR